MKKLTQQLQWLHYEAPWGFKLLIFLLVLFTFFGTCSPVNADDMIIRDIQTIRKSKEVCPCDYEIVGVICSNGVLRLLPFQPINSCACGNFTLDYWICKQVKPKEL